MAHELHELHEEKSPQITQIDTDFYFFQPQKHEGMTDDGRWHQWEQLVEAYCNRASAYSIPTQWGFLLLTNWEKDIILLA